MLRSEPVLRSRLAASRLVGALDRRLVLVAAAWTVPALLGLGILTAIIPSPIFIRPIPPEPFAITVWLVSAPLIGLVVATYMTRPPITGATPIGSSSSSSADLPPGSAGSSDGGSTLGTVGGILAFVAIGCPVCNKIILLLLGTSGALTVFAPLQPIIGAASVVLLAGTAVWRLRLRARGNACAVAR